MKWPELLEQLRHEDHIVEAYDTYMEGALRGHYEACASFEDFIIVGINEVMTHLGLQMEAKIAMLRAGIPFGGSFGDLQVFSTGCTALLGLTQEMDFEDVYENMLLRHQKRHEEGL